MRADAKRNDVWRWKQAKRSTEKIPHKWWCLKRHRSDPQNIPLYAANNVNNRQESLTAEDHIAPDRWCCERCLICFKTILKFKFQWKLYWVPKLFWTFAHSYWWECRNLWLGEVSSSSFKSKRSSACYHVVPRNKWLELLVSYIFIKN